MAAAVSLQVRVSAQISEFQKAFKDAAAVSKDFADDFEGIATRATAVGTIIGNVATSIARSIGSGLATALKDSIKLSQDFNNAFIGLSSVSKAFGTNVDAAKNAARSLSADGLLPLKDSTTSLKNLLASGFNLPQATKLIDAFKDSAAFGRQGSLSFGDAVRTATEGIKNGNSILVDNAGITKNLSVILTQAGKAASDVGKASSDASVRQALYNGILKEAVAFQGDAARAANTYTGQVTALETSYKSLLATLGNAITTNQTVSDAIGAVGAALRSVASGASDNQRAFNFVSDAVIGTVRAFSTLLSGLDIIQIAFNELVIQGNKIGAVLQQTAMGAVRFAENAAILARALNPTQWQYYTDAIKKAQDAELSIELAQGRLEKSTRLAKDQQEEFSNLLGGLRVRANELADGLEKTRGKVVALGESGDKPLGPLGSGLSGASEATKSFGKELAKLTAQINLAVSKGTDLPQLMKLFGSEADKANQKAKAWGLSVAASVGYVASEFNQAAVEKTFTKLDDGLVKLGDTIAKKQFVKLAADMHEATVAGFELNGTFGTFSKLNDGVLKLGETLAKNQFAKLSGDAHDAVGAVIASISPMRDAFLDFGKSLPDLIFGTLQHGGSLIGAIASGLGAKFAASFQQSVDAAKAAPGSIKANPLNAKQAGVGAVGVGLSTFIGGYGIGASSNKTKGVLGGAAAGALAGAAYGSVVPVIGTALGAGVGAAVGAIGGYFGGRSADKKAKQALEDNKTALLQQYGGMDKLRQMAEKLGVNIQAAFDAKKPEQFQAAVESLNTAIDAQNKRVEGLAKAMDGVNARAATFGKQFSGLVDEKSAAKGNGDDAGVAAATQKMQALAQQTQPEFERLGLLVSGVFAGMVKDSGNAYQAIQQLAPSFQTLKDGVTDFGLSSTGTIDTLLKNFDLVNNQAFAPLLENVQNTGAVLSGLFDAKSLSPDVFQAAAADIGQSLQEIANKGGDMGAALALSQPVLQKLWEAQQTYGGITDQTTQSILDQAQKQGLVGEAMKSVNDKILDVLLAIGKVLGADLPTAAQHAADGISDAFAGLDVPPIDIRYRYRQEGDGIPTPQFPDVPALASGGIVTRPTLALIGERGPEAVVPLSRGRGLAVSNRPIVLNTYLDGRVVAQSVAENLPGVLQEHGV